MIQHKMGSILQCKLGVSFDFVRRAGDGSSVHNIFAGP